MDERDKQWERTKFQYRHHPDRKRLLLKAQQALYRKDILQPWEEGFKTNWHKQWNIREQAVKLADREDERLAQERAQRYRRQLSKRTVTLEQKTLREISREHPRLVNEGDVAKWPN